MTGSCFFCEDYARCRKIGPAWVQAARTCPPGITIQQHRKSVIDELFRVCQAEKVNKTHIGGGL
jgi:hypothetical protein